MAKIQSSNAQSTNSAGLVVWELQNLGPDLEPETELKGP